MRLLLLLSLFPPVVFTHPKWNSSPLHRCSLQLLWNHHQPAPLNLLLLCPPMAVLSFTAEQLKQNSLKQNSLKHLSVLWPMVKASLCSLVLSQGGVHSPRAREQRCFRLLADTATEPCPGTLHLFVLSKVLCHYKLHAMSKYVAVYKALLIFLSFPKIFMIVV